APEQQRRARSDFHRLEEEPRISAAPARGFCDHGPHGQNLRRYPAGSGISNRMALDLPARWELLLRSYYQVRVGDNTTHRWTSKSAELDNRITRDDSADSK